MDDERIRLVLDLAQSSKDATEFKEKLENVGVAAKKAGDGLEQVDAGTTKVKGSMKDTGRGVLELSQAFQDLGQGGVAGILNNIDGIVMKFGGTAGLAAAISATTVAVYLAVPAFKALWAELAGGANNDVPRATDNLKAMGAELDAAKKRLHDLADQGKLTNTELAEFNSLTAKSIELEKASNDEKERRNTLDSLRKKENAGDAGAGEIATAAITANGGVDKTVNEAEAVLAAGSQELRDAQAKLEALVKHVDGQKGSGNLSKAEEQYLDSVVKYQQGAVNAVRAGIAGQAGDLVAGASKGDAGAINRLAGMMPGAAFQQATPEGMADADAFVQQDAESAAKLKAGNANRRANAAQARNQGKATDEFTAEGAKEAAGIGKKELKDHHDAIKALTKTVEKQHGKAIRDTMQAARHVVGDKPLPMDEFMPMTPDPTGGMGDGDDLGFDPGLDPSLLMPKPKPYRRRTRAEGVEAFRAKKARTNRGATGGSGFRSVGVSAPSDDGSAKAMGDLATTMKQYGGATQQVQGAVSMLQGLVSQLAAQLNIINGNNRTLMTRNNLIGHGGGSA